MNKCTNISTLLPALLLAAGTASAAAPAEWAPLAEGDLRSESLPASVPAAPSRHSEPQPVRYAWPLEIDRNEQAPAGPSMDSRQYWIDTDGRALERGLKLPLSAPGAIVRLSALHEGSGLLLDANRLEVELDGISLARTRAAGGIELLDGSDLQAQGMSVPSDSLAFKLPDKGQPRSLQLQLAGAPVDVPMVVHVFEPQSPWRGALSGPSHHVLAGGRLELDVALTNGDQRFPADSVQAVLVSPDAAQAWPLEVTQQGLGLVGTAPQRLPATGDGLYEVHAYLEGRQGDTQIRRDVKIALQIAVPTARLNESIEASGDAGLKLNLGVDVAASGRYQISAQVWGTDVDGRLQPLAMAQTAAVLQPGKGELELEVPAELVLGSGLQAPFSVRELQLFDQGRMTLLESRSRGISIGRDEGASIRPFDSIEQ